MQFIIQQESCQRDLQVGIPESETEILGWVAIYFIYSFLFYLFITLLKVGILNSLSPIKTNHLI